MTDKTGQNLVNSSRLARGGRIVDGMTVWPKNNGVVCQLKLNLAIRQLQVDINMGHVSQMLSYVF